MYSKCSIIIPTNNRSSNLHRLLDYYNNKTSCEIIIGDTSSKENKNINRKIIQQFPNLKITYLDNLPSNISLFAKIPDFLNLVKTKYCVLCADDDFIVPTAITKSIKFLEKHRDYIAVGGRNINFWIEPKGKKKVFRWSNIYQHNSITKSNRSYSPISRLLRHFAAYTPTFYYVHRTKFLKNFFNKLRNSGLEEKFLELLPSALTVLSGKIKFLNTLFGARNAHEYEIKRRPTLLGYIKDKSYFNYYNTFESHVIPYIIIYTNLNQEEARKLVYNAYLIHRKHIFPNTFLNSNSNLHFILKNLRTYLKISFMDLFLLLFKTFFQNRYIYFKIILRKNFEKAKSKSFDDFKDIRKHVLLMADNNDN